MALDPSSFEYVTREHDGAARFLADEYLHTGEVSEWTRNNYAEARAAYEAHPVVVKARAFNAVKLAHSL